ncbi:RNA polymerase sigma-70 factor [Ktedonosporobacter rubrisoli]|uniref:RNA polymerase sigma-70 factor n=1 Tax=Ktedonosporobacter rubrisoli TaxID=2509675 RepID=A0A4P6JLC6_KTERU|nr:RNA polymerase sigma-70 factor [Ktedonosporobacter rubrisoli]QBD76037.1 RNA polymerase sigma-70 factor [Ktedonosporobacter rubrisoli]
MPPDDVFQAYKPLLFSIAYNMLGSVMDAEDCVQEAFLRWYQASTHGETEAIHSPKAFLCTIVTRLSIDHLRSARVQREHYVGIWLPEPLITTDESSVSAMAELAETLSLAFLRLLEQLSPVERAVFLLRQVFDYDYAEIARIVQKSEENCRQIVRRARQHLGQRRTPYHTTREQQDHILQQFLHACMSGDMDGLLSLLSADIVSYADSGGKAVAARNPIIGADRVARYLLGLLAKAPQSYSFRVALVNGQPGILNYIDGRPHSIVVLHIMAGQVKEIDVLANPDKLRSVPPLS